MIREFRMPKLALGDDELKVIEWSVEEGETVSEGDVMLVVQTDKTDLEVEATSHAILARRLVGAGDGVAPGSVVAVMVDVGSIPDAAAIDAFVRTLEAAGSSMPTPDRAAIPTFPTHKSGGVPLGLDSVKTEWTLPHTIERFVVREGAVLGIPPRPRPATATESLGNSGIASSTQSDPNTVGGRFRRIEPTRHRLAVSRSMTHSASIPQFPVFRDMLVTECVARLQQLREAGVSATMTDVLLRSISDTLMEFPALNAWHDGERRIDFDRINLGLAVDGPDGVIAPTIFDVANINDGELCEARADIVGRARNRKLRPADLVGATFTVSNVGALGANAVAPMIAPPQVAILGVGRLRKIGSAALMTMALVADHRAIDGADSARFLGHLETNIASKRSRP